MGAGSLQLHPLEVTGRVVAEMADASPGATTLGRAYLTAMALAGHLEAG